MQFGYPCHPNSFYLQEVPVLAKRFFYVSAALFLLALTYHLGAKSATAQVGTTGFAMCVASYNNEILVMTPSGEIFARAWDNGGNMEVTPLYHVGNFWGGATSTTSTTWGQVKDRYRK